MLKLELNLPKDTPQYYWTDSRIVLGDVTNDSKRFHTFVANRVRQIRDHSLPSQWHYVETGCNPADHASRGVTPSELTASNWFRGPAFLWMREVPFGKNRGDIPADDREVRACAFLRRL